MIKLTQNSWLSGQLDAAMAGRQDMKFYRNGASVLKNFIPTKIGSFRKRPGTDLIADISEFVGDTRFRLIPFGYLSRVGCVLVFGERKARVYFADGSSYDVQGEVPYLMQDLDEIGYVQCGDIIYLAHKNHPPAEIRHDIDASGGQVFTYSAVKFNPVQAKPDITSITMVRRPFEDFTYTQEDQNLLDQYLSNMANNVQDPVKYATWKSYYDNIANNKKLTWGKTVVRYKASLLADGSEGPLSDEKSYEFTPPWTETQDHKIKVTVDIPSETKSWVLRLYKEHGGVYGLIGTHAGSGGGKKESFTFNDDNIIPDTSETPIDTTQGELFAAEGDYPGAVGLYQQRLVWAGSYNDPARIWMSRVGDFYEYRPHVKLQTDDAIDFILPITQFANLNFIIELGQLFAFSECTELVLGSASSDQGISFETITATEHSHLGCTKRLPPIVANNSLLFVSKTGASVRDYDVNIGNSRYGGTDVSILSSSIFVDNPIVDWTWQQEPNSCVWCVLADGRLASFVFIKEQEIAAWAVHELGGGGKALGIAKTCAVFGNDPEHPNTGEVMVAVKRGERVTLERMRPFAKHGSRDADSVCMDCVSKSDLGDMVRSVGGTWGYPFESEMTTMRPILGDAVGNAQFDVKLGQHAHLRLIDSYGGEVFATGCDDTPAHLDADGDCDRTVILSCDNNRDGRVTVRQDESGPFECILLEVDYEAEEGS